ncbi:hypothetical protein OHA61_16850 [Streptomyces sp. NBC_00885]|uniref:hypothetical protein n=1 Tax=Streptomyces sp. NBC_00885 TaxID=2975857 RepID=UPI003870017F|nr:hypothetical protein OHA61_16850 [Streptomyces sp. NBC_00885]
MGQTARRRANHPLGPAYFLQRAEANAESCLHDVHISKVQEPVEVWVLQKL